MTPSDRKKIFEMAREIEGALNILGSEVADIANNYSYVASYEAMDMIRKYVFSIQSLTRPESGMEEK